MGRTPTTGERFENRYRVTPDQQQTRPASEGAAGDREDGESVEDLEAPSRRVDSFDPLPVRGRASWPPFLMNVYIVFGPLVAREPDVTVGTSYVLFRI